MFFAKSLEKQIKTKQNANIKQTNRTQTKTNKKPIKQKQPNNHFCKVCEDKSVGAYTARAGHLV